MTNYVLDTDHLSLYGRNHPPLISRLKSTNGEIFTTAINVEEQLRGRLAQVAEARTANDLTNSYQRLTETLMLLSQFQILLYDMKSHAIYQSLKTQRVRVGTQDLRIAAIVLAHGGILLTRNTRDFEKVPDLIIQDWSI